MAMLEHFCTRCEWFSFDNVAHGPAACPLCGARVFHQSDELPDHDDSRDELDERDVDDD